MVFLAKRKRIFGLFSFTSLVVNSIIGADIYVITTQTARLSGVESIWAWIVCGIFALIISLSFAQCASFISESGGAQIYIEKAFGKLAGFVAGWIFYISVWVNLIVFPLAFLQYLNYFIQTNKIVGIVIKTVFVAVLTLINLLDGKLTSKIDNVITFSKVLPLIILIGISFLWSVFNQGVSFSNLASYSNSGFRNFGEVMLLIFWAYAGFELSVLPSAEVRSPRKTVPRGIIWGIVLVTALYLLVNISVFLVLPQSRFLLSNLPLVEVVNSISKGAGWIVIAGALMSICGVTFAIILELSRLLEGMAVKGYVPRFLARVYGKENLPYFAIVIPSGAALIVSLAVDVRSAITFSVILLSLIYLFTGAANWKLHLKRREFDWKVGIISLLTIVFSMILFIQGNLAQYLLSGLIIFMALMWYMVFYRKHTS